MFESEQETRKLYIATHTNPILYLLSELFRNTEQAALGCAAGQVCQVARFVAAVVNTEQAALACADCSVLMQQQAQGIV